MNKMSMASVVHFAAQRHAHQNRKGAAEEPYINHLCEVAELISYATDHKDTDMIAAAYLHDTIEDTATSYEELAERFGTIVADLVREVTDDKSLPKEERKLLQIKMVTKKSPRARLLKIADKTSNLRSIATSPPIHWSNRRKEEYLDWARAVCGQIVGNNAYLDGTFEDACEHLGRLLKADRAQRTVKS